MTAEATAAPPAPGSAAQADPGSERRITGAGLELAVLEWGERDRPTIVLIHGFPDRKEIWRGVAARLALDFHVVAYDVRGAGASGDPPDRAGFDLARLADDFEAVIDAVAPGEAVHLVGHDWGSIQGWEFATQERFAGRIASFTSISGPSLDHIGRWIRRRLRRPTPRGLAHLAGQGMRSWYVGVFGAPGLAERAWLRVIGPRWRRILTVVERVPPDDAYPGPDNGPNAARGIGLYRRNVPRRLRHPRGDAVAHAPVQLVVPRRERYVSRRIYDDLGLWAPTLRRRSVAGGHWVPLTQPALLASWIAEFASEVEHGKVAANAAAPRPDGEPFADRLVLVTGAGSGIGRATALAFARAGARVLAVDVDGEAADRTAAEAAALGAPAAAYQVDVGDAPAMKRLAAAVAEEHGVLDVLVNNAGIGVTGPFLDTSVEDWERLLHVNLWGVIHGCRLFARQMVDAGRGGRIVNVASAAAFQPAKDLPAYGASKAAVLMLSECLRAELAEFGIGVTAVCPGLIRTNITRTAQFVGLDEAEQARMRERVTRLYRLRNYTPERVAEQILRGVRRNSAVIAPTPEAKAARVLYGLAPPLLRRGARINPLSR